MNTKRDPAVIEHIAKSLGMTTEEYTAKLDEEQARFAVVFNDVYGVGEVCDKLADLEHAEYVAQLKKGKG